ncbi:rho-GTPase-activating protein-like protein [Bisporella sp. PMI_857]|nr:rho-GTPase-activating protein-like protein [Bisporella sp. PMI_857]
MPSFADSFWSGDYAGGLGVLFGKLQQGVAENEQMLTIARMRAEAEDIYGQRLGEIGAATDKIQGGFSRDDGASVRKAYDGVRTEMEEASRNHRRIAQSIRDLVVAPFTRWCDAHASRVQGSQEDLQARIKLYDKQTEAVKKLRSHYFNKCRLVEDIEEENKLAFQSPETSPKPKIPEIKVNKEEDEEEEPLEIADEIYQPEQVKKILTHILQTVKLGETKVPILGMYQNTTAGAELVEYFQKYMGATSVSVAERIGQDLVGHGFLRLIGSVGNIFANSSKMFYQWRPKVFQLTGIPEKKQPLNRTFSIPSDTIDSPVIGSVGEYLAGWNPLNTQHPNETPADRLRREAAEADDRYKAGVRKLDLVRCQLEEAVIEHLKYLERCELDRLKAIKTIILDFSGTISNVIPSLQSTVDKMMLYQETVQPAGDLRYLLENYRTGAFAPRVTVYENYYNSADEQTFGVDLEARARSDRKRVPAIITTILTFLDNRYPDLEGDEARRSVWLVEVPLHQTHRVRDVLNTGKAFTLGTLEPYEIPIIASVLKLYLLELPDSLVSSHVYEIMKTIYSQHQSADTADAQRIAVLQSTLSQLRLSNIATLDALMTHFTRLIELTSADETYISALATTLAPCILRPRTETSMTMEEKYSYRLVRDLFTHKEAIFTELKRASSLSHSGSVDARRPRAISTDESNRKANQEARARAIMEATGSRSRATSPAPSPRGHRRDRSSGGPETRFPIQTSPVVDRDSGRHPTAARNSVIRQSLEVPDTPSLMTKHENEPINGTSTTNGSSVPKPGMSATYVPGMDDEFNGGVVEEVSSPGVQKRDSASSLGRVNAATARFGGRKTIGANRNSLAEASKRDSVSSEHQVHGVQLTDKPMDD